MIGRDVMWPAVDARQKCSGINRRWGRLVVVIVAASFTFYTIFWFFLAHILQNRALLEMGQIEARHGTFRCDNIGKTGYLLRIGVRCSNLSWQNEEQNILVSITNLVADAPVYAPSHRSIHLQAPAYLELSPSMIQNGISIDATWDILDIQADFSKGMVDEVALSAENLRIKQTSDARLNLPFLDADFIRFDMGFEAGQLIIKLLFDELVPHAKLEEGGSPLPGLNGDIHMSLDTGHDFLLPSNDESGMRKQDGIAYLLGQSGQIQRAMLRFASGGELEGQGSFHFSQAGFLSGDLTIAVDDMVGLQRSLRPLLPAQAGNLETLFFVLNTMPKNAKGTPVLPVRIDEGHVRIGFLPIGKIPSILLTDEAEN